MTQNHVIYHKLLIIFMFLTVVLFSVKDLFVAAQGVENLGRFTTSLRALGAADLCILVYFAARSTLL